MLEQALNILTTHRPTECVRVFESVHSIVSTKVYFLQKFHITMQTHNSENGNE